MNKKLLIIPLMFFLLSSIVTASLSDDTAAYYKFQTNANDETANNYDGTVDGAEYGSAYGIINGSYKFDGSDNYIQTLFTMDDLNDFTNGYSWSAWAKSDITGGASSSDMDILEIYPFYLKLEKDTDKIKVSVRDSGISSPDNTASVDALADLDTSWHHYVVTWNSSTGTLILYINNVKQGEDSSTGTGINNQFPTSKFNIGGEDTRQYWDGFVDEVAIFNTVLTTDNINFLYNSGSPNSAQQYPYAATPTPTTIIEYTEQTIDFEQPSPITILSTSYQDVMSGTFEILNKTNLTAGVTFNAYADVNSVNIECRINIDGTYYNSTLTNTIPSKEYRSMYISTLAFEKSSGNYTGKLQCKKSGGSRFTISKGNAIIHILQDEETEKPINHLSNSLTRSITTTGFSKIASINFTTTNHNVTPSIRKHILLNGFMEYDYDSTGTITVYASINGVKLGEYPRYGTAGSSGNVGGLRLQTLTSSLNISETIPIDIYAKSTTGDGEITGNFIIKEILLHNDEVNTILLNDTSITSTTYQTIKSFTINNTHTGNNNLVVKAGIPYYSITNPAESTFRLRVESTNGQELIREVSASNQDGVVILQDVFQVAQGQHTVYVESKTDETILINGGDLSAYMSDIKLIEYHTFNVTAYDNETSSPLLVFNVTTSTGSEYFTTDGTIIITPTNSIENLTITAPNYLERNISNHNTSNDIDIAINYIYARMQTKTYIAPSNAVLINSYTLNITSLNSSFSGSYNTTNGTINLALPRGEVLNGTIDALDYAITTELFTATYNQVYNFSVYPTNSININIFDLDTGLLIDDRRTNITINGPEYQLTYTTNGTIFFEGLLPGTYQLDLIAPNFAANTYYFTLADRTHQTLNTYLSGSCNEVTFLILDTYQLALDDVVTTFNQQINGSWVEIGQRTTDVSGSIEMCLQEELHMIQASKTGYETWEGDLTPFNSEYSIILDILGSQVYETLFEDVTYLFSPTVGVLNTNLTDFTLTTYSPGGKILYFGLNTTYNGTYYISNSTTSPSGGSATIQLPLSEENQNFKVTFFIKTVSGNYHSWDQNYQVYDYSISQYSLVYLFDEWEEQTGSFTVLFWVYIILAISLGLLMLTGASKIILIIWSILFIGIFSSPMIEVIPLPIGIIQGVVLILITIAMGKRGML